MATPQTRRLIIAGIIPLIRQGFLIGYGASMCESACIRVYVFAACVWHVNNWLASIVWTSLIHITGMGIAHSPPPWLRGRSACKHALMFDRLRHFRWRWKHAQRADCVRPYEAALFPLPGIVLQRLSRCSCSGRSLSTCICVSWKRRPCCVHGTLEKVKEQIDRLMQFGNAWSISTHWFKDTRRQIWEIVLVLLPIMFHSIWHSCDTPVIQPGGIHGSFKQNEVNNDYVSVWRCPVLCLLKERTWRDKWEDP